LVRRAAQAMQPLLDSRGQHLTLDLPEAPVIAAVDAERLGRVLQNLLANANKYGNQGGQVQVRLEPGEGGPLLSVSDDGPGIPRAEQERIFDRFYRGQAEAARQQVGSGLGLPIARGLVELHGGKLWVDSSPGQGATFSVWLPARVLAAATT
jgi:two-component system, OmpR family, phosphate regulon sensor histidine kinase PhoR